MSLTRKILSVVVFSVFMFVLADLAVVKNGTDTPLIEAIEQVMPTVAHITVTGVTERTRIILDENGFRLDKATVTVEVTGSGVFVSPNNHVLTCAHLFWLDTIKSINVCKASGECTFADLIRKEDDTDLGLVQTFFTVPTEYSNIADPRDLRVGQEVFAVGSPLGLPFSVSHGIISRLNTDDVGYNMTQSDTFLNPGNSGGPLFNMKGEIVGINSRIVPPINAPVFTGLGFSVSSAQIIEFVTRFRGLDKSLPRSWK